MVKRYPPDRPHKVAGHAVELSAGNFPKVTHRGGRNGPGLSRHCERVGIKLRLFGPRVLYVDRRRFDLKPKAERPQQQWIVDQDIIPMVFTPCPADPIVAVPSSNRSIISCGDCLSEDGVCVGQAARHLARLKVFVKVRNQLRMLAVAFPEACRASHPETLSRATSNWRRSGPAPSGSGYIRRRACHA
jgi:hypothetical protein